VGGGQGAVVVHFSQDHVDMVTRPDQPGGAADRIDAHRGGTHSRPQHRGEEAVIAGPQQIRRQQRLLRLQAAANHGPGQVGPCLRGVGAGALGHRGGQHLVRLDVVEFQQTAGAQRVCRREHLHLGRWSRCGLCQDRRLRRKLQPDPPDQAESADTEHNSRHQGSAERHGI
jgi:hypothetical protein